MEYILYTNEADSYFDGFSLLADWFEGINSFHGESFEEIFDAFESDPIGPSITTAALATLPDLFVLLSMISGNEEQQQDDIPDPWADD